ncbi:MAG: phenylalanine--tRNA ligase subunit alpha [Candidatus Pacearchaeota archaeon]|nr:phenylalanine--tRNA ligase subunit alpha [Candidatus Pacearchaeota archaeon]
MDKLIETLSPIEREIIPYLNLEIKEIIKQSGRDETSVLRALNFLERKEILKIKTQRKSVIVLGVNGVYYLKNHLPERRLLGILEKNNHSIINDLKKMSKLSENEFKASIGALKRKSLIELKNGKIYINAKKEELTKKFPEEIFLEKLPLEKDSLTDEEKYAFEILKNRKEIIEITEKKKISFELTEQGKKIAGKTIKSDLLEEVTPEIIKNFPRGKKFRKYDIKAGVPKIYGGKKHFVTQSIEQGKRIWQDLGFKEMSGNLIVSSFWNFDALFTAQDHPVREMHDTFFIKDIKAKLPKKELVNKVKQAHESGISNSKGWNYLWNPEEAKSVLLRTHTTCISAKTLSNLNQQDLPAKFFSIGKVFRNETVDWSHGFEFNQTEGIVIDPKANFRHLIGYLKEFAKKMGYEKIRIQPAYFPYTEPSIEGAIWNEERKEWVEMLAAGIFRPEVTIPLLGTNIPVLAWGPGFDRLMMEANKIKDLRDLYKNDLKQLREKRAVIK